MRVGIRTKLQFLFGVFLVSYAKEDAADRRHSRLLQHGFVRLPAAMERGRALAFGESVADAVARESAICAPCSLADMQDIAHTTCFGCDQGSSNGTQSRSFLRARRLVELEPSLTSLVNSPELARLVASVMQVPRLRLYQATAFVKRPGDGPSAWHQDSAAMPLDSDRVATLWVALNDLPGIGDGPPCGLLRFARGSHLPGVPVPSLRDLSPAQVSVS